jgi:hypothetical protein
METCATPSCFNKISSLFATCENGHKLCLECCSKFDSDHSICPELFCEALTHKSSTAINMIKKVNKMLTEVAMQLDTPKSIVLATVCKMVNDANAIDSE